MIAIISFQKHVIYIISRAQIMVFGLSKNCVSRFITVE